MNGEPTIIEVGEALFADNERRAFSLGASLRDRGTFAVNLMGSPGCGKTTLIERTAEGLPAGIRVAVVEADLASSLDARRMEARGIRCVQLNTGGYCHLDAAMTGAALEALGFGPGGLGSGDPPWDIVFIENIGNLVCTAQSPVGAGLDVALLSRPEGDDKPFKYPVMFRYARALVLTKRDYDDYPGLSGPFDVDAVARQVMLLNPAVRIFDTSCRSGAGMAEWISFLHAGYRDVVERRRRP